MQAYDYVIVGGGTAGCVLAARLSEDGNHSVLLLEAGPEDNYVWIHVPIGYGKTMFHPVYNWGFYTEPEPTMNGRKVYWPRGRGLGGCSSINGLIYVRGQPQDYDAWAAEGNAGWSWRDVLPYFKRLESNERGASEWHGASGPLAASDIPKQHELIEAIIDGAGELGIPRNADFNGERQEGIGYYQLNTRKGWRSSTATGYLKPARKRPNLAVEVNAQATRVLLEGTRATGVEYRQGGRVMRVQARREVLLAAGALQSPQLLQLSGIGPGQALQALGIPVVADLPGVGENLQDHLQLRLIYQCRKPITTNDDLNSWWRSAKIGMQWILFRSGPLAVGINQGGLFTTVLPESTTPDVQFHFATLSAEMAGAKVHPFSGFTFSVCQLRPSSRGRVTLASPDPLAAPLMHANYLATDRDRRCAVAGVKFARRIAETQSMQAYVKSEYRPGPAAQSEDELLEFCRNYGATIFHPVGTCRMGSDAQAVVDARLRVHGVAGLRVVDCSMMPTIPSGNTAAPVVMVAEKAADLIRADARDAA
jgi:choline dehydrogenase